MKRPLLPSTLLGLCILTACSGCATLRNVKDPSFGKTRFGGTPVAITTVPAGAAVSVDGRPVGISPLTARLTSAKSHHITATKADAGEATVITLAATKDRPARRFAISAAAELSEMAPSPAGELSLTLAPSAVTDALVAALKTVRQSDELEAAGKLSPPQHAELNRKIVEHYSRP